MRVWLARARRRWKCRLGASSTPATACPQTSQPCSLLALGIPHSRRKIRTGAGSVVRVSSWTRRPVGENLRGHMRKIYTQCLMCKHRADSRFAPSQWETALLCNDVSHWQGANMESALKHTRTCQNGPGRNFVFRSKEEFVMASPATRESFKMILDFTLIMDYHITHSIMVYIPETIIFRLKQLSLG